MLDINANQSGALPLPSERADRTAEIGARHQKPQQGCDQQRADKRYGLRNGNECHTEINHLEGVWRLDGAGIGAPQIERQILDDHRQTESNQQDILILSMAGMAYDKALQAITDRKQGQRLYRQGKIRIDTEQAVQEEHTIERQHQQASMGEIDDVQNAVDQRQPQRNQSIDRAGREAVQD